MLVVAVVEVTVTDTEVLTAVTAGSGVACAAVAFLGVVAAVFGIEVSNIVGGGGGGVLSTWIGTGRMRAVNFF